MSNSDVEGEIRLTNVDHTAFGVPLAGRSIDWINIIQRPNVVLRFISWIFSIIVFGCITQNAYKNNKCIINNGSRSCSTAVAIGSISSFRERKKVVVLDGIVSAAWTILWLFNFIQLITGWSNTKSIGQDFSGQSGIQASITFSFLSVFSWALLCYISVRRTKNGSSSLDIAPNSYLSSASGGCFITTGNENSANSNLSATQVSFNDLKTTDYSDVNTENHCCQKYSCLPRNGSIQVEICKPSLHQECSLNCCNRFAQKDDLKSKKNSLYSRLIGISNHCKIKMTSYWFNIGQNYHIHNENDNCNDIINDDTIDGYNISSLPPLKVYDNEIVALTTCPDVVSTLGNDICQDCKKSGADCTRTAQTSRQNVKQDNWVDTPSYNSIYSGYDYENGYNDDVILCRNSNLNHIVRNAAWISASEH
ncbi:hypothetical protein GJ496_002124 [Pomphorhynchus laevis]|nr:hypothetical protein GJ496_002124 [Pomphorhynchus laevis]